MATPLDPWIEAWEADPLFAVVVFLVALVIMIAPEVLVGLTVWAPRIRRQARGDFLEDVENGMLDPAIERATAQVRNQVQEVYELVEADELRAKVESIDGRLTEFDDSMATILERMEESIQAIPERLKMAELGRKGAMVRELNKAGENAAREIEAEAYELLTPEERIAAQLEDWEPDESKGTELGRTVTRGVKELIVGELRKRSGVRTAVARVSEGGKARGFQ